MIRKIILFILVILGLQVSGQDRFTITEQVLSQMSAENPGLNQVVDLSVSGVTLEEFIRGIATANNLNVSVDHTLQVPVASNFSGVQVKDVLIFLARKYDLEFSFTGNIIQISSYKPLPVKQEPLPPKPLAVHYNPAGTFTMDLFNDSLYLVTKAITKACGKNVVLSPAVFGRTVSGYFSDMELFSALEKLAYANGLSVTALEDGSFLLDKHVEQVKALPPQANRNNVPAGTGSTAFEYQLNDGHITLDASNVPVAEIIHTISTASGKDYFIFSELKGNVTLKVTDMGYDEFLGYVLNGSEYTFKSDEGVYLIGNRNDEGLRATRVVQLQNRTVENVMEYIPAEIRKGVEVKTFADLNSFILSGSLPRIQEIEAFLRDIDRVVPVVMIDVIIVDVNRNRSIETKMSAGIGNAPEKSSGVIHPGVDVTLNSASVNDLIGSFNGFGIFNLGKVTPDFYLTLKMLENNGVLKTRSTPKLSSLNGHQARMSIGKTEYYIETQNSVIGTQNPQNIVTQQYKSVNADLFISILPVVSADGQITLEIQVQQSDFTSRITPSAPPGTVQRDFQSLIRVKNGEMVILGGLEEEGTNDSGTGLPLLSRIPVLKWLFSSRVKEKHKTQLNIFIRPTIIY